MCTHLDSDETHTCTRTVKGRNPIELDMLPSITVTEMIEIVHSQKKTVNLSYGGRVLNYEETLRARDCVEQSGKTLQLIHNAINV